MNTKLWMKKSLNIEKKNWRQKPELIGVTREKISQPEKKQEKKTSCKKTIRCLLKGNQLGVMIQ